MCLLNVKTKGKNYKISWKIFVETPEGLFPFKPELIKKPIKDKSEVVCNGDGFSSFIKKEDAKMTMDTIVRLRKDYPSRFTKGKVTLRKIIPYEITTWGFNVRINMDLLSKEQPVNSIRCKRMKIL